MRRLAFLALVGGVACTGGAPALVEGDPCEVCRMVITDTRFGGQVVLTTGRTHSFDAAECLVDYLATADSTARARVLVSDFETGQLIDADRAVFVEGSAVSSPMGRGLIAVSAAIPRDSVAARYGGNPTDLAALRAARRQAPDRAPPHQH